MNIIGIIPARTGSKRLPGKNTRILGGKPLIKWVLDSALNARLLDRVVVSTDSDEIINFSPDYNDEKLVFVRRPEEISKDNSPAIDYVRHTLNYFKESFDIVVILQPSSPFTLPTDIDGTIKLLTDSEADSAVSIVKLPHDKNPLKMKTLQGDRLLPFLMEEKNRMAEADVPEIYIRNGSVYASKIEVIKEGKIISTDCRGYIMSRKRSVDINDEFDLVFAEFLFSQFYN